MEPNLRVSSLQFGLSRKSHSCFTPESCSLLKLSWISVRWDGLDFSAELFVNMDSFKRRLAEQVRQHKHLYDSSLREHRDNHMVLNSWRKIASTLGKEEAFCRKMWKNMRDTFVRAKKKIHAKGCKRGRFKTVPPILLQLEWLSEFTSHRETDDDFHSEVSDRYQHLDVRCVYSCCQAANFL